MTGTKDIFSRFAHLKTIDVTDEQGLRAQLEELLQMKLSTPEDLARFFEKRDEIERYFETECSESYFLMAADVDDAIKKERHVRVEQELAPLMELYRDKLHRKVLEAPPLNSMPPPFDVVRRSLRKERDRFRPDNLLLNREIEALCTEITELQGKLTVPWNGTHITLPEATPFLQELNRDVRKQAFEAILEAKHSIGGLLDEKFSRLVRLRHQVAVNAGYENYIPYRFDELQRFEWGPPECRDYHQAVKKYLFPLRDKLFKQRKEGLGLQELRPFDLECDPAGQAPLRLFAPGESNSLVNGAGSIIAAMDDQLHAFFRRLRDQDLLDLEARRSKADAAFMVTCPAYRQAAVFMAGTGLARELLILLHELGHCFHFFLGMEVFPYSSLRWTTEVAEIGSTGIELMGLEELGQCLDADQAARVKKERLRQTVLSFVFMACGDEFQHWLYAHPDHSVQERHIKWLELSHIYKPDVMLEGYEAALAQTGWQFIHILQMPFYLIDYAISELAALTLWDRYKINPREAMSRYRKGCALNGSRPVPEIFEAFGTTFRFGDDKIKPLAVRLETELNLS